MSFREVTTPTKIGFFWCEVEYLFSKQLLQQIVVLLNQLFDAIVGFRESLKAFGEFVR